ncbi:GerAB/ArcD/ProY family transporter [Calorimonas adulescens]|jgi:spore germination protein (amino acid permease)|uniref:GerAB/ArcD/ProY family transporter n=1 Tax=Calorimonas adulescens TaxID=2606906 RepID=A0A5D8QDZ0_9THEO|nr:GerAB/ArcD/ProY family transporter [Calorimonas adulescens]TZE82607.1 GerAB/ArcD/ProY family transporter [Calorimonas adulescens]
MDKTGDTKRVSLSPRGFMWLMINTLVSLSVFLNPSPTVEVSRQYAWISVLIGTLQALMVGYIVMKLGLRYPDKTVVEYSQEIVGKFAGKVVGLVFILTYLSIVVIVLREFTLPFQSFVTVNVPLIVILILTMVLILYAVLKGLKTIGICSDVVMLFLVIFILLLFIMPVKNINTLNIKPIIPHDIGMAVRGSFISASFLAEDIIALMIIPYVSDNKKLMKYNQTAILVSGICLSLVVAMEIMTMSCERVDSTIFSTFMLLREAQLSQSMERLEAIAIAMWTGLVFIKLSIYFFITVDGLRQWLGLKDYKVIAYVLSPIVIFLAMLPENISEVLVFPSRIWTPIVYPVVLFGLPLLLLIISIIKESVVRR